MVVKNKEITETEFVFLRCFYPEGKDITLKEIQKRTGYSYERAYSYLKGLVDKGAIIEKIVGKTLVYSLDFKDLSSKVAYLLYATKRTNEFLSKEIEASIGLSELSQEESDLYLVFGSYAKGMQKENSDLDLLCVTSNKEKIENAIASIKRRYNLNIHALIIPRKEFIKIEKENKEFWEDLIKYGIIFKGYELFYYHAYNR